MKRYRLFLRSREFWKIDKTPPPCMQSLPVDTHTPKWIKRLKIFKKIERRKEETTDRRVLTDLSGSLSLYICMDIRIEMHVHIFLGRQIDRQIEDRFVYSVYVYRRRENSYERGQLERHRIKQRSSSFFFDDHSFLFSLMLKREENKDEEKDEEKRERLRGIRRVTPAIQGKKRKDESSHPLF